MSDQSTKFTFEELAFMYGLVKEAKSDIQEYLQEPDLDDSERNYAIDTKRVVNSCYRKLKMIVSDNL